MKIALVTVFFSPNFISIIWVNNLNGSEAIKIKFAKKCFIYRCYWLNDNRKCQTTCELLEYIFWVSRFWKIYWNVNWRWYWQQIYFMLVVMPGVLLLPWNNDEQTIYADIVDGWTSTVMEVKLNRCRLHAFSNFISTDTRHKSTLCKRGKAENSETELLVVE